MVVYLPKMIPKAIKIKQSKIKHKEIILKQQEKNFFHTEGKFYKAIRRFLSRNLASEERIR